MSSSQTPTQGPTMADLQAEVAVLRAQLAIQHQPPVPAFRVKVADPPPFTGQNKRDAGSFLAHLKIVFSANPSSFPTDSSKIVYAASWLRERAFEWFEPVLRSDGHLTLSWDDFESQFLRAHGDADLKKSLTNELQRLSQTGSAASYSTRFFQLATQLHWNDAALTARFYEGLKEDVKDALAYADRNPQDVYSLSELATRLDNRLHERRKQSRTTTKSSNNPPSNSRYPLVATRTTQTTVQRTTNTPSSSSTSSASRSGPAPMDVDASAPRYKPLTEEEKQYRRDNDLCSYCGQPNHIAINCPRKSNRARAPRPQQPRRPMQGATVSFSLPAKPETDSGKDQPQGSR